MLKKLYNYTVNYTQLQNKCKKNNNTNILCVVFKVVLYTYIIWTKIWKASYMEASHEHLGQCE